MKKIKTYVCHANECSYNKQGSCINDSDCVIIGTYNGGPAICPNFNAIDSKKLSLVEGLYQVLVELLIEDHGDAMKEDIRDYELYTSADGTVYMTPESADDLQSICVNNDRVIAIVDAINVLQCGRVLKVTEYC